MKKLLLLCVAMLLCLTACGTSAATPTAIPTDTPAASQSSDPTAEPTAEPAAEATSAPAGETTKLSIQGSTSVTPLMEKLVDAFVAEHGEILCEVQGTGSSAGIKAAIDGTAQIGMSSRNLKEEELAVLTPVTIAMDGIAVVVNPENPVKALTREQIASIFKGETANWKELGGEDTPIVLISREAGSGTRSAFEELLELQTTKDDKTISLVDMAGPLIATGNGEVKQNVATKKNAIGYLSLGSVDETLHALDVDGIQAKPEYVKDGTYPIARPFLVVTKGAPSAPAQLLIDLILGEKGQAVVADMGYIPVAE